VISPLCVAKITAIMKTMIDCLSSVEGDDQVHSGGDRWHYGGLSAIVVLVARRKTSQGYDIEAMKY